MKNKQNTLSQKVSIAMCTYNGETYLSQQLDSIINQTYPYITEIEDDKVTIATNEQKYKSALCMISDITLDYDRCNTVESLKELIDEVRDMAHFALKNNNK